MPTLSTWQKRNFFCSDIAGNVHTSSYLNADKIILRIWHFYQWGENGYLMDGDDICCWSAFYSVSHCLEPKSLVGNGQSFCGRWNLKMKRVCLAAIAKVSHRKLPHILIAQVHTAHSAYCTHPIPNTVIIAHYKSGSLTPTFRSENLNSKEHTTHCNIVEYCIC